MLSACCRNYSSSGMWLVWLTTETMIYQYVQFCWFAKSSSSCFPCSSTVSCSLYTIEVSALMSLASSRQCLVVHCDLTGSRYTKHIITTIHSRKHRCESIAMVVKRLWFVSTLTCARAQINPVNFRVCPVPVPYVTIPFHESRVTL